MDDWLVCTVQKIAKNYVDTVISAYDGHVVRPKHVEKINKYTKKKLCTMLASFTRLYRDALSTKHKNSVYVYF